MPSPNSQNDWVYNCPDPGKNDLDYRAIWGDNGTITIQRNLLRSISYELKCTNSVDGTVQTSQSQVLPQPTSDAHTFNGVYLTRMSSQKAPNYWAHPYTIQSILTIIFGPETAIIDEEITTTVNGCFYKDDPHYTKFYDCEPPDEPCN